MINISITREQMIEDLNDYFTGLLESWTCGGETRLNPDHGFVLFNDWVNIKGEKVKLILPNKLLSQCWHNHGTCKLPEFFIKQESMGNTTLMERIWKRINGFK
jgi:hypothetical protein